MQPLVARGVADDWVLGGLLGLSVLLHILANHSQAADSNDRIVAEDAWVLPWRLFVSISYAISLAIAVALLTGSEDVGPTLAFVATLGGLAVWSEIAKRRSSPLLMLSPSARRILALPYLWCTTELGLSITRRLWAIWSPGATTGLAAGTVFFIAFLLVAFVFYNWFILAPRMLIGERVVRPWDWLARGVLFFVVTVLNLWLF